MTLYEQLLAFVEHESELVERSAWAELTALDGERRTLLAGLPQKPPPDVRELLETVLGHLQRNAAAIALGLAQTRGDLDRLGRSRKALGSYAQPPRPQLELLG